MAASLFPVLLLSLFSILAVTQVVLSGLLPEDGYTVSTIINGDKLHINPYSILPQVGSSDLIILDSHHSTFYSVSFPSPQEPVIKKLAGNGAAGYADGELGSAMFNKPKSFAVDFKGNIYVADMHNHTIRKISESGVTTIAGGYSQITGHRDGPAQNASFSDDFELVFIPERCALMISDHGSRLVRQINLKVEDCARGSQSGLGSASAWALGLGLSCLLGLAVGFVSHPYVISRGGLRLLPCNKIWNHCLISLERRVSTLCFDIRSEVVSSTLYMFLIRLILLAISHLSLMFRLILLALSHLSLMFRIETVGLHTASEKRPSLLNTDDSKSNETAKLLDDQLKDLISFDEGLILLERANRKIEQEDGEKENIDVSDASTKKLERMIQFNIMGFSQQDRISSVPQSLECSMGLFKRK